MFKQYSNALASVSALLVKAIENISLNNSKKELEKAKEELREEISDVRDSIGEIGGVIDGTFQDNVLDEVERRDIQQNLDNLTREKIDIDNTYNSMYSSEHLNEEDKSNFKLAYDEYIDAFNLVVSVSTNILNKESLIDNVDRANLNSAIARHIEKLNAFYVIANTTMDLIALNKSNKLKSELEKEISEVDKRVDDALKDISGAVGDGIIDQAEALII